MKLKLFQVDAFTNKLFKGNPAAVIPLRSWLDDDTLQNIAAENNLSETAFFVKEEDGYRIRWMTPTEEINLCGHATVATSFVMFNLLQLADEEIRFNSKSGELIVTKKENLYTLNFPANIPTPAIASKDIIEAVGKEPIEVLKNKTYVFVYEKKQDVIDINPDIRALVKSDAKWLIVTAPGDETDFVSRFFAPGSGIDEDPVTGYAHTVLTPYWSNKLNKKIMTAHQLSKRGGELTVEDLKNGRVKISGEAVLYLEGEINI